MIPLEGTKDSLEKDSIFKLIIINNINNQSGGREERISVWWFAHSYIDDEQDS